MSTFKSRLLASLEEPCAQLSQRDLVEPEGLKRHQNENSNDEMTQQIVPVTQTSVELSSQMTHTLKEQKEKALKCNGAIDEAITSQKTSKFSTPQLTFARRGSTRGSTNNSTGKELIKSPTSQLESQLKSFQRTYGRVNLYQQRGYQLKLKPSKYPQESPIRRMLTLHQKSTPSPSTKLNQAKSGFQVASTNEKKLQHFQSRFAMPEKGELDLSNKSSHQGKFTNTTELTEMHDTQNQKSWTSVPSLQSDYARTVTKSATVKSNELLQLTSQWLPYPIYNYSQASYGINSRELIHLPTSLMESKFLSNNYMSNGSPNQNYSEWNENNDSNKDLMSSPQVGNSETLDSDLNNESTTLEKVHEQENPLITTSCKAERTDTDDSSGKYIKLVPYGVGQNYRNSTWRNVTKSTDLIRTVEKQDIKSTLASSQFYSDQKETNVASNELIEQSISSVPGFHRASPESPGIIDTPKSGMESTISTETVKELTSSQNVDAMQSNLSNKAAYSETEPETQIPLSTSKCPQINGTDGNTSSNEQLSLVPYEADHNYAKSQLNAMTSTASLQQSGTAEMQSQVILSSSQFNSVQELLNGAAVKPNDINIHTTSKVTENNDQESIKQRTPDQQATKNETLNFNLSNDSTWDEIGTALSQQMYFLPDTSEDITSTEQLQFFETSPSNEIIISNELTNDPASSGTYYTSYIINGPTEQASEADAAKQNGSKSIGSIQPKVSSQITLPSLQSHYSRAVLANNAIQSSSDASSTKSTFVRKASNFVIQSDVLITPSKASPGSPKSTQNSKIQQGKPEVMPKHLASQSKLKAPVNANGSDRVHPYAGQKKSNECQKQAASKLNAGIKLERKTNSTQPTSSNTLIKSNGSIKQPTSVVKLHLNLPLKDGTNFEVPQVYSVDRVKQKSKTNKVLQWGKLPQPSPKPTTNSDPKRTPSKRKLKENISPMIPSKKRLLEKQVGVKITRMLGASPTTFRLPEISLERTKIVRGVEQKVGVAGINFKTPLEPISKNKTLSDCAETLLKNNVSVFQLPSKPVDKAIDNFLKILEKNNVRVVKVSKK